MMPSSPSAWVARCWSCPQAGSTLCRLHFHHTPHSKQPATCPLSITTSTRSSTSTSSTSKGMRCKGRNSSQAFLHWGEQDERGMCGGHLGACGWVLQQGGQGGAHQPLEPQG